MIWAILSEILNSISLSFWKKAINFNAPKELFKLLEYLSSILIVVILYFLGFLNLSTISLGIVILLFLIVISDLIISKVEQVVYKRNKLSSLLPYRNISNIIVIVFGFLIYKDVSLLTFFIAILATLVIVLFSIDFKNYTVPKDVKIVIGLETLSGITKLLTVYIVKEIGDISYFVYLYVIGIIFLSILAGYKGQFKKLKTLPKQFYYYRLSGTHIGGISYILSLFVIQNLGATLSVLVSYIGLIITLLFSYLFLKEKINKKDVILSIIVTLLIGIGYIYK